MSQAVQALDDPRVRDFIGAARVAHLATASAQAEPHNIPLCFCFEAGRFYFAIDRKPKRHTGAALKRMRNIAHNPRVALVIDHYEEDWSRLAWVLVHGSARIVTDAAEYALAIERLRGKYPGYREMKFEPEENPVVRIEPVKVAVWGARFDSGAQ